MWVCVCVGGQSDPPRRSIWLHYLSLLVRSGYRHGHLASANWLLSETQDPPLIRHTALLLTRVIQQGKAPELTQNVHNEDLGIRL